MEKVVYLKSRNSEGHEFVKYEDDIIMPAFMMSDPEKRLADIKSLQLYKDSVIVATYPKSGTHWVSNMILRLRRRTENDDVSGWGFLDASPMAALESKCSAGNVFATHFHPGRLPDNASKSSNVKIVLVLRNPKDVVVSYFHALNKMAMLANKQDWDEFIESFMEGSVPWGSLIKYLKAWENEIKKKELDIEVFYYEDFIGDCFGNLKKLAEFIGVRKDKTDDDLAKIVEECSIDNLRTKANESKTPVRGLIDKDGKSVIYRKGGIGDWKNHFTVAQNEMFDKYIAKNFSNSCFTFNYV